MGDSEDFEGLTYGGGEDGPNSVHREKSSTNQNSVLNYKDQKTHGVWPVRSQVPTGNQIL